MQLSINEVEDKILEWIPYNQFNGIKEVFNDESTTIYLAIWKDGPLYYEIYDDEEKGWMRESNRIVNLKCLHNSQSNTDELLNEIDNDDVDDVSTDEVSESEEEEIEEENEEENEEEVEEKGEEEGKEKGIETYSINKNDIYGISQNPDTKDYIIVLKNKYCESCNKEYTNAIKWCESCKIDDFKKKFTKWTSGNDKIDNFIQEMQLKSHGKI
ncbi:hypothetical protein C1645_760723 [Glomus cerebriforme]|uniref:Uncharacterized protein n=1 Tax=Glomus cerebriforme TaxID=658196 RepID=A0A397TCI6_9GLOM|nr:hypothetical protein C1645_760723 [Glomus cerebriforme]